MKPHVKRCSQGKTSFQPRLEALENRCCPAVTMSVLDGHILQVVGDRGDNVIEFDQRGSEIGVTGDGAPMQTFTGVDTIRVNTWAGRDIVRLVIETPPPVREFFFTADLGASDDSFSVVFDVPPGPCMPEDVIGPTVRIAATGADGNDTFRTFIAGPESASTAAMSCLHLNLSLAFQGDNGNDSFHTGVVNVDLDGAVAINMAGGQGDDTFSTHFTNVDALLPAVQRIDGGDGNDIIENTYTGDVLDAPLSLHVLGGNGNDKVSIQAERTNFDGAQTLTATVGGGAGNDFINVAIVDPVGDLYGDDRAHANLSIDGGDGHDQIGVQAGQLHDAPDPELRLDWNIAATGDAGDDTLTAVLLPAVQRDGSFMASFDGGEGRDMLTAILLPAVQSGGSFKAVFDGGDGRDTLTGMLLPAVQRSGAIDVAFLGGNGTDFIFMQVDMTGFTPESGRLRVSVDGGNGSDSMIFLVRGAAGPAENVLFTLDGGAGEDFALVSAMVHVTNCEHVEIV